jgi:hypothetical protein
MSDNSTTGIWTISLCACTSVLLNEIEQELRVKDIALTYGMALVSEARDVDKPDWKAINRAITAKWRQRGLVRVKNLAWKLVNGTWSG